MQTAMSTHALLTGIAALLLATGAAGIYYWLPEKELPYAVNLCIEKVQEDDQYTLYRDNKQRVLNWCTDRQRLFDKEPYLDTDEWTEQEKHALYGCLGGGIDGAPNLPRRTLEEVFDYVSTVQVVKKDCYGRGREFYKKQGSK